MGFVPNRPDEAAASVQLASRWGPTRTTTATTINAKAQESTTVRRLAVELIGPLSSWDGRAVPCRKRIVLLGAPAVS
jgi:hypothetical protein